MIREGEILSELEKQIAQRVEADVVHAELEQVLSEWLECLQALDTERVVSVDKGPEILAPRLSDAIDSLLFRDLSSRTGKDLCQDLVAHLAGVNDNLAQSSLFSVLREL
jgi:hypothetical protein